jgi:hypothetical protein
MGELSAAIITLQDKDNYTQTSRMFLGACGHKLSILKSPANNEICIHMLWCFFLKDALLEDAGIF